MGQLCGCGAAIKQMMASEPLQRPALDQLRFVVAGFGSIGKLEDAVDDGCRAGTAHQQDVVFDFAEATFIELQALQYVIAFALARRRLGLATWMALPGGHEGRDARDFLRRWKFPEAVQTALKMPFEQFVVPTDLQYFKKYGGDTHAQKYAERKHKTDSVAIIDQASDSSSSSGIYVASRIVFEAMTNAIRHPGAKFIQTSSLLRTGEDSFHSGRSPHEPDFFPFFTWKVDDYNEKGRISDEASDAWSVEPVLSVLNKHLSKGGDSATKVSANKHFTVSFWDDGQPMDETLRAAIVQGIPIRDRDYPEFETEYHVRSKTPNGELPPEVISSSITPDKNSADQVILLSTLFPGITCDVSGRGHRAHTELLRAEPKLAGHGMGLFALVRTAIDEFGGSVAFRTGKFFMSVKRARRIERPARYRVKIEIKPTSTPQFLGNMITVRLPLRSR